MTCRQSNTGFDIETSIFKVCVTLFLYRYTVNIDASMVKRIHTLLPLFRTCH